MYKEVDWEDISAADPHYVTIKGFKVPYVIFRNEPEITDKPAELGKHLEEILQKLWELRK